MGQDEIANDVKAGKQEYTDLQDTQRNFMQLQLARCIFNIVTIKHVTDLKMFLQGTGTFCNCQRIHPKLSRPGEMETVTDGLGE